MNTDPIYGPILLPEVTIKAPKKRGFWEQFNLDRRERHRELSKSPSGALWAPFESLLELPQAAMSYYLTSPVTSPHSRSTLVDKALGIEDPYLALGATIVLDPLNVVGGGMPKTFSKARRLRALAKSADNLSDATTAIRKTSVESDPQVRRLLDKAIKSLSPETQQIIRKRLKVNELDTLDPDVVGSINLPSVDVMYKSEFDKSLPRVQRAKALEELASAVDDPVKKGYLDLSINIPHKVGSPDFLDTFTHEAGHLEEYFSPTAQYPISNFAFDQLSGNYFSSAQAFRDALTKLLDTSSMLGHQGDWFDGLYKFSSINPRLFSKYTDTLAKSVQALEPHATSVPYLQELMKSLAHLKHPYKTADGKANELAAFLYGLNFNNFFKSLSTPSGAKLIDAGYLTKSHPVEGIGESFAIARQATSLGTLAKLGSEEIARSPRTTTELFTSIYSDPKLLKRDLESGIFSGRMKDVEFDNLRIFNHVQPTQQNVELFLKLLKSLP